MEEGERRRQVHELAVEMHAMSSGNSGKKDCLDDARRADIGTVNPLQAGQNSEARHYLHEGGLRAEQEKSSGGMEPSRERNEQRSACMKGVAAIVCWSLFVCICQAAVPGDYTFTHHSRENPELDILPAILHSALLLAPICAITRYPNQCLGVFSVLALLWKWSEPPRILVEENSSVADFGDCFLCV